ncbi:MAG: glycosyltransferase family 9 protein [Deltaproteobacteria bacterium]|nr:glycosyltransferase family 9 protein [Deltaproteobacteria bacterium]
MAEAFKPKSVLFIRRDNIGDLVCTTPAIRAVRLKYPEAEIAVLVTSYNVDIVRNNPDIDEVFIYEKEKHRAKGKGVLKTLLGQLSVIRKIRSKRFDAAIGCAYSYSPRLARLTYLTGAKLRIGYAPKHGSSRFYNSAVKGPSEPVHEVLAMMRLLKPLGIEEETVPRLFIRPDEEEVKKAREFLKGAGQSRRIALFHISSRRPENRWPLEYFKELGDMIESPHPPLPIAIVKTQREPSPHKGGGIRGKGRLKECGFKVLLTWSPGSKDNPLHPGDDEGAEALASSMKERPILYKTERLSELIAALSLADIVVCLDGGAMHIAAGLKRPVVAIWGSTDERRWAPWAAPHIILKKDSKQAWSVAPKEAIEAFMKLSRNGR